MQRGFQVTLEIGSEDKRPILEGMGTLPPDAALLDSLQRWQRSYRNLKSSTRIQPVEIVYQGSIHQKIEECQRFSRALQAQFKSWLASSTFQMVDQQLRENLGRSDRVRIVIRTDDPHLQCLPWHLWDLVDRYPYAEVGLSAPFSERVALSSSSSPDALSEPSLPLFGVKILAILGHSRGIDVETDRQLIESLPGADVTYLVEPEREQISEQLWNQPWDVLFFAGHSVSQTTDAPAALSQLSMSGRIYINPHDSLSIEELKYGFRQAISNGLQLAIFNSCDGLGLAQDLKSLKFPHMILMREPVPDYIAQTFLRHFLSAYASGLPLYLAERQARERLQGLEDSFPCASWLPVMVHASPASPPNWQQLRQQIAPADRSSLARVVNPLTVPEKRLWSIGASLAAVVLVSAIRWLGGLQPWELHDFDRLMRQQLAVPTPRRVLIVEATEADINTYGYPLPDEILAEAIAKINAHTPRVIGLDIFRPKPSDDALKQALQQTEHLVAVCSPDQPNNSNRPGFAAPPNVPEERLGFASVISDPDGVVRRQLMFSHDPNTVCATRFSLATLMAFHYLEKENIYPENLDQQQLRLGQAMFVPLEDNTGPYHDIDSRGFQIFLSHMQTEAVAERITLSALLKNQVQLPDLSDQAVLIGMTAPMSNPTDYFLTSQGAGQWPQTKIAGVVLHAYMLNHLLVAAIEGRGIIRGLPGWGSYLWITGWAIAGTVLSWQTWRTSVWGLSLGCSAAGLYGLSWAALGTGIWVPLSPAALALLLSSLATKGCLFLGRS